MTNETGTATRDQIVALQTLYSKWDGHVIQATRDSRTERIAWASGEIGREIASFSDLTRDEARTLIDALKASMGQALGEPARPWRKIRSRDRAQAAGTAGRRGPGTSFIQMASADDLARIDEAISRLGWTRDRYEAWLRSASSPLKGKEPAIIRTMAEANKVWWALKNILRRSGNWRPSQKRVRPTLRASV